MFLVQQCTVLLPYQQHTCEELSATKTSEKADAVGHSSQNCHDKSNEISQRILLRNRFENRRFPHLYSATKARLCSFDWRVWEETADYLQGIKHCSLSSAQWFICLRWAQLQVILCYFNEICASIFHVSTCTWQTYFAGHKRAAEWRTQHSTGSSLWYPGRQV